MGTTRGVFFVYVLASLTGSLYVGLTDNLPLRVHQHKKGIYDGFTKRHRIDRLMYYEVFTDSVAARERELQVKGYSRKKKIALFEKNNPEWRDLTDEIASVAKAAFL